jgi:hypothetical protein
LASSAQAELINPIRGGFRGNTVSSLNAFVDIRQK